MNTMTELAGSHSPSMPASRTAGTPQIAILLAISSLVALVTAVLGPALPALQAHFADVPNADVLVPMIMSAPSLSMALLCIVAGELADRWGRKRLLVVAAIGYAVVGTMPLYLGSLPAILASRFLLGAFEAFLMTIGTALIGDYYGGLQRDRYMTLQTTATSVSAVIMSLVGGLLAAYGWRTPFAAFGVSLLFAPLILALLWEPVTRAKLSAAQREDDSRAFRPGQLAARCALAVVAGLSFLIVGAHLGYLLKSIGVESTQQVGMAYAINSLGMILGTFLYALVMAPRLSVAVSLGIGGVLAGGSLAALPFTHSFAPMVATGTLYGLAMGIFVPTLVAWNMRELPLSMRGRGTGAFQSSLFLGMFLSPPVAVLLERATGAPRAAAIAMEGHALLAVGVAALLVGLARRRG